MHALFLFSSLIKLDLFISFLKTHLRSFAFVRSRFVFFGVIPFVLQLDSPGQNLRLTLKRKIISINFSFTLVHGTYIVYFLMLLMSGTTCFCSKMFSFGHKVHVINDSCLVLSHDARSEIFTVD